MPMNPYSLRALRADLDDLLGALHVLAEAARARGDQDLAGGARLCARQGEAVAERLEILTAADAGEVQHA